MKLMISKIAFLAVATLLSAQPILAAEGMGSMSDQGQQTQKDECLLVSRNCGDRVDSIQQRIDRINHEIGKGTDVYSQEELMHLQSQLGEANKLLETMTTGA